ncbi:MAG: class I SAM-dependent methyltransferase, partial [Gammaproteobacteria bacterium]
MSSTSRTAAYIRDVAYLSSFNGAQSPVSMSYVSASQCGAAPDAAAPFRYLELGSGDGATLTALAAACPHGEFIGVDFNAQLVTAARESAAAASLGNIRFIDSAFSALDASVPGHCDYVACNGTWSWLDEPEKAALLRIVGATLRDGGLLYLGYATVGRQAVTLMWQLMRGLLPAGDADSVSRLKAGLALLLELRAQGAQFLQDHPTVLAMLDSLEAQVAAGDRRSLENVAHNALANAYRAELVDEVAAALSPLGLALAGSADPFLNDPDLCVPPALRQTFDRLETRVQRELYKDCLRSTTVRRDVFRRGDSTAMTASQWLESRARATLSLPRPAAWQQVTRPAWTRHALVTPASEFVFERLTDGATSLPEIAEDSVYTPANLRDAFTKLVACPGIEPCLGPTLDSPTTPPRRL